MTDIITKCDIYLITKCNKSLLQNVSGFLLRKVAVLLQNSTVITKCVSRSSYYKTVRHYVKSVQIQNYFWSVFSHIRTEYGEILRMSPYSVRMRENLGRMQTRITPNTDTFYAVSYISYRDSSTTLVEAVFKQQKHYLTRKMLLVICIEKHCLSYAKYR